MSIGQILLAMSSAEQVNVVEKGKTETKNYHDNQKDKTWISHLFWVQKRMIIKLNYCKYNRICQPYKVEYNKWNYSLRLSSFNRFFLWFFIVNSNEKDSPKCKQHEKEIPDKNSSQERSNNIGFDNADNIKLIIEGESQS